MPFSGAAVVYFENALLPGRPMFHCSKLTASLQVSACTRMWQEANWVGSGRSWACRGAGRQHVAAQGHARLRAVPSHGFALDWGQRLRGLQELRVRTAQGSEFTRPAACPSPCLGAPERELPVGWLGEDAEPGKHGERPGAGGGAAARPGKTADPGADLRRGAHAPKGAFVIDGLLRVVAAAWAYSCQKHEQSGDCGFWQKIPCAGACAWTADRILALGTPFFTALASPGWCCIATRRKSPK